MSNIHELRLARWERIRQRGPWRFALLQGILRYGGFVWLIFAAIGWSRYAFSQWVRFIALAAIAATVGGFLFGILMYVFTMWTYHRYKTRFS